MYFKLCQNCDRFFYSSAAFSAHNAMTLIAMWARL